MTPVLAQTAAGGTQVVGSSAEFWVFAIAAVIALGAGLSVVVLRNAVHAALMLVINFFAIAVLYAALEAQFLAVVQIIVYAGAIMVLFLFVLMLLGIGSETRFSRRVRGQAPASVLLGLVLVVLLVGAAAGPFLGPDAVCPALDQDGALCTGLQAANQDGNVPGVGELLFTTYMWPFEVTSALLVIAAVGAMVLGKRRTAEQDVTDRRAGEITASSAAGIDEGAGGEDDVAGGELVAAGGDSNEGEETT